LLDGVSPGVFGGDGVALQLAGRDRQLRVRAVRVDDGVAGVLPALVVVAPVAGPRLILLQAVAVSVAIDLDPVKGPLDMRTQPLEQCPVGCPTPELGGVVASWVP
jgi:hypothetical protein